MGFPLFKDGGKPNINCTSQQTHQVDRRLRSNTDILIECESYEIEYNDEIILVVNNKLRTQDGRVYEDKFIGNPYFNLYDTEEIIDFDGEEED